MLRNISPYNMNSVVNIKELVNEAKRKKYPFVGMVENGSLHYIYELRKYSKEAGVHALYGISIEVDKRMRVTLFAQNEKGMNNLFHLSCISSDTGVGPADMEKYADNLICVADIEDIYIEKGKRIEVLSLLQKVYGSDKCFTGLKEASIESWYDQLEKMGYNPIFFPKTNGVSKKDLLTYKMLREIKGIKDNEEHIYFLEKEAFDRVKKKYPSLVGRLAKIAAKCEIKEMPFENKKVSLPAPSLNNNVDENMINILENAEVLKRDMDSESIAALNELCDKAWKGLTDKYKKASVKKKELAVKRLQNEIDVINKKGYVSYFLVVKEFIDYAKEKGVEYGEGRGSAVGSVLSYVLDITRICPIENNLLFERFQNLERDDAPDIDIDVSKENKNKIISFAIERFGRNRVSKIVTFSRFQTKQAIKDVGKVLGMPSGLLKEMSESVYDNKVQANKTRIQGWLKKYKDIDMEKYDRMMSVVDSLIGLPSARSTHPAGIVLTEFDVLKLVPAMIVEDKDTKERMFQTQFPKEHLEEIGMLKLDFLTVKILDAIENTKEMIKEIEGINIEIPEDDTETMEFIAKGNLSGVFQMESEGMQEAARKIKPKSSYEIHHLIALYRPGAMKEIDKYINRKQTGNYLWKRGQYPEIDQVLKETHGTIIFQEQIMTIAKVWAGYEPGESEMFRRAISKKDANAIEEEKEVFMRKSKQQGRNKDDSEELFKLITSFGKYGFNKSHAVGYSRQTFKSAYLLCHYPIYYLTATMQTKVDKTVQVAKLVENAEEVGVTVQKPDINSGFWNFELNKDRDEIMFGLASVKNVSEKDIEKFVRERESGGKFTSIQNVKKRIKDLPEKSTASLIKVGAFDSLGEREEMLGNMKKEEEMHSKWSYDSISKYLDSSKKKDLDKYRKWEKELLSIHLS